MRKKRLLTLWLCAALAFPCGCFAACGSGGERGFTRAEAAQVVCEVLGFAGGDLQPADVDGRDPAADAIRACVARAVFDEAGAGYRFRPDDPLTHYELAKVCVYGYAALLCTEDENLAPGAVDDVTGLGSLRPDQRWYVHVALSQGFLIAEDNAFAPDAETTEVQLRAALGRVKARAAVAAVDMETYRQKKLQNFRTFPAAPAAAADAVTLYRPDGNRAHNLAACTLQGLVNREEIRLYVDYGGYDWMSDFAIEKGYFDGYDETVTEIGRLLGKFADQAAKVVVYDPERPYTINTAVDVAGVEGRVVIAPELLETVRQINPRVDVFDLRALDLSSQYEAQLWSYEHCFEYQRRDVIGWTYYGAQTDYMRDYPVQMKIPTLWIPGSGADDYDERTSSAVGAILQRFPVNIPVIGFQYAFDPTAGANVGIGEFTGVQFCGEYGKYTAVFDSVGNLSFHTALPVPAAARQLTPKPKEYAPYDPAKKYVAITMTESGDAPCYIQYGFFGNQWSNPGRESVPYNYSYGLLNYDLNPLLTQYWAETMTEDNYFFGAISGLGYSYPLGGYGNKGAFNDSGQYMTKDEVMIDHYVKANEMCRRLGLSAMGVYSYSSGFWSEYEYADFDRWIAGTMSEIEIFAADMHRAVPALTTDQLVRETSHDQRIYHCSTYWGASADSFGSPNETAKDALAVEYLVGELRANTTCNDGHFYQCMAYSWNFGPRRLRLVMDRMEALYPGVYEFVTLDELDYLYRSAAGRSG